jgi:hypothetical protein
MDFRGKITQDKRPKHSPISLQTGDACWEHLKLSASSVSQLPLKSLGILLPLLCLILGVNWDINGMLETCYHCEDVFL